MDNFIITNHARERFVERFSKNRRLYAHLGECGGCSQCVSLLFRLRREVKENRPDEIMLVKLQEARETKVHHNNLRFMHSMYEKYGYQNFHFLVGGEIIFVVVDDEGKVVVTCLDAKSSILADFLKRPKYRKKVLQPEEV